MVVVFWLQDALVLFWVVLKALAIMPMTLQRWAKILSLLADERACASCYAYYFKQFLSRRELGSQLKRHVLQEQYLIHGRWNKALPNSYCKHRVEIPPSPWPIIPSSRKDYAALLQTSKDCRCDFDWASTSRMVIFWVQQLEIRSTVTLDCFPVLEKGTKGEGEMFFLHWHNTVISKRVKFVFFGIL